MRRLQLALGSAVVVSIVIVALAALLRPLLPYLLAIGLLLTVLRLAVRK